MDWAEKPVVLTVTVAESGQRVALSGILRPYYSLRSLHGWTLVPPQQHGGFDARRLTELDLDACCSRDVVSDPRGPRLRFANASGLLFELERDDVCLTAPPRSVRPGRYLYVGGRRRPAPEPWMLR